jgi:hypothetical protein
MTRSNARSNAPGPLVQQGVHVLILDRHHAFGDQRAQGAA